MTTDRYDVRSLFDDRFVKFCAPMVRYSKLPFRILARRYGCDATFTPMILSESFVQSQKARDSEFTTNNADRPLIVQFAANRPETLQRAAELVYPFADGIDLNCGCPQRWAMAEGYGAHLIEHEDLLYSIIRSTRQHIADTKFSVSVKIRIHNDVRRTIELGKRLEHAGASWLTVHGRTKEQRTQPVNLDAIKLIREHLTIPVVANGDITSLDVAADVQEKTGCHGVMAARGMLENPAMFAGFDSIPLQCLQDWVNIALEIGTPYQCFHQHLIYMMEHSMNRSERRLFNSLNSMTSVLEYLETQYGIGPEQSGLAQSENNQSIS